MDQELSRICARVIEENWEGLTMNRPPIKGGTTPPQESQMSLRYKGIKMGGPMVNQMDQSLASGQNPTEQEEGECVEKSAIISLINSHLEKLDINNNLDRSAIMILTDIKQKLK